MLSGDVIEEREEVEGGDDIPDNVIRIESQMAVGEYIEIEFDENDNLKDIITMMNLMTYYTKQKIFYTNSHP